MRKLKPIIFPLWFSIILVSCTMHADLVPKSPINLISFSENGVSVRIALLVDQTDQTWLVATFTPLQAGFHLYSTRLPRNGLNSEGRPTLLELPSDSTLKTAGNLSVSANEEVSSMGPDALLVYPAGPITLSLPVVLPYGKGWAQEQLSITYEACSNTTCLKPVIGKLVLIRVPEAELISGD